MPATGHGNICDDSYQGRLKGGEQGPCPPGPVRGALPPPLANENKKNTY